MADIPGIANDIFSRVTEKIRAAINAKNQRDDILGRIPMPTHDQLREKELAKLTAVTNSTPDWKKGGSGPVGEEGQQANGNRDIRPGKKDRGLQIIDLETGEKIILPFVPDELDYSPDSKFVDISAMGRNNPLYQYTGSEDTLKFTIDWFFEVDDPERIKVIQHCRKLEALSKNDGFGNPPHKVKLLWNNFLFSDAVWIVSSAPYKLSQFHGGHDMLPTQAYQLLTLKRITELNLGTSQIRKITN